MYDHTFACTCIRYENEARDVSYHRSGFPNGGSRATTKVRSNTTRPQRTRLAVINSGMRIMRVVSGTLPSKASASLGEVNT